MKASDQGLKRDDLVSALDYDPETGVFAWKISTGRRVKVGDVAGSLNSDAPEDAHAAYCAAADKLHGEFGRSQ